MSVFSIKICYNLKTIWFVIANFPCQVKLSSKSGQNVDIVWTENSLLITATGEHVIRSVYRKTHMNWCLSVNICPYLFILGCGTWSEMTIMFCLWTRLWGLREERCSTVFHTVRQKVTEILVLQLFAVHVCVDLVLVRPSISPHSQTSSRNFNATVTVKPYFA